MACQNITVQLDASGNASIVPADVDNGSSDNCSVALSLDISAFTCADLGANAVVLTGTDPSGNTATCNATVTVEDNVAPVINCQDITVQLDASGNASILPATPQCRGIGWVRSVASVIKASVPSDPTSSFARSTSPSRKMSATW